MAAWAGLVGRGGYPETARRTEMGYRWDESPRGLFGYSGISEAELGGYAGGGVCQTIQLEMVATPAVI